MIKLLLVTFFVVSTVKADVLIKSVSYYDGLGTKMRNEKVYKNVDCKKEELAGRIFVDETNELREISYIENGRMRSDHAQSPKRPVVDELFKLAADESKSPCNKVKAKTPEGASAQ